MGRPNRLRGNASQTLKNTNMTQTTKRSPRRPSAESRSTNPIHRVEQEGDHENEGTIISPTLPQTRVNSQERTPIPIEQRLDSSGGQEVTNEVKQTFTDMNSNRITDNVNEKNSSRNEHNIKNAATEQKTFEMNSISVERSPAGRNLLKQLQTSLSPKLTEVNINEDRRVSRYGRHQKQKENINYVPVDLMKYVSKSQAKVKPQIETIALKSELGSESINDGIGMGGFQNNSSKIEPGSIASTELSMPLAMQSALKDHGDDVLGMDVINIIQMDASFENISDENMYLSDALFTKTLEHIRSPDLDSAKGSSVDLEVDYSVGEMYWGALTQRSIHWPCIVRVDPESNQVTRKRRNNTEVHVAFFGDRGRRGWIREAYMLPFHGLENYRTRVENLEFGRLVKSALKLALRQHWKQASMQADEFFGIDIEERLKQFDMQVKLKKLRDISNRVAKAASKRSGKRRRSCTPESPPYEEIPLENATKKMRLQQKDDPPKTLGILKSSASKNDGRRATIDRKGPFKNILINEDSKSYTELVYKLIVDIGRNFLLNDQQNDEQAALLKHYARKISLLKNDSDQHKNKRTTVLRQLGQLRELCQMLNEFSAEKRGNSGNVSVTRVKKEKLTLEEEFIFDTDPKSIIKGVPKGFACYICERPQNVVKCGKCLRHMHLICITADTLEQVKLQTMVDEKSFNCYECTKTETKTTTPRPKCFVCNDKLEETKNEPKFRCTVSLCSCHYHLSCLQLFPQFVALNSQSIICPYHVCHTCVADDPRGKASTAKVTLVRCIKCPSSYHPDMGCIPAGSEILTTHQLICPKHSLEQTALNVNWCCLCCKGGDLICCETCPNAFHRDCLPCVVPEGKYFCEECESGRFPLYNEIVIVKLGNFRWWPALIVPPSEISENVLQQRPSASSICVKFFQSHTVSWLNRRRMYLYQHDDSENLGKKKSGSLDKHYRIAMAEASKIYQILQTMKSSQLAQLVRKTYIPPPVYVKIKNNKYVAPLKLPQSTADSNCYCRPDDADPCGPTSSCINRAIMIECIPKICPAKERCSNQRFARRLYPALEVHHFAEKGYGLVSKEEIRCGQFIIEYVGEVINAEEFQRRIKIIQERQINNYYFLTVEPDMTIDAGTKGNVSRFINHSCEPNCETQKWTIGKTCVIGLFAIRDIRPGEELTFNYNLESLGNKKRICLCGAARCSGFIGEKYRPPIKALSNNVSKPMRKGSAKKLATNLTQKMVIFQTKKVRNDVHKARAGHDDDTIMSPKIEPETIDLDNLNENQFRIPFAVKEEREDYDS